MAEERRRSPKRHEALHGDGHVEATPPVVAEMSIVKRADILLRTGPVPADSRGCEVHDKLGHPTPEGALVNIDVLSTPHAPNGADGGDAKELPEAKKGRMVGRPSRPSTGVIG